MSNIKKFKVLIKLFWFGCFLIYPSYLTFFPEKIPINIKQLSYKQPETLEIIFYSSHSDHVKLQLVIHNITKTPENFNIRKTYYLKKVFEFTCENEVLKTELNKSKPVIIDFLSDKYANSQFANLRVTLNDCTMRL